MEVQSSAAESQSSDRSQPNQEMDGDGGSKLVAGPADVVDGGGRARVEAELGSGGGGAEVVKKKRGRPPRAQVKSPPAESIKEEEEDVCFICFDGGSLVLCDRRGCPKAYHPACVKRDDAFFQSKAKWNCGWHICSICEKAAHHLCYTCTYSLCKRCIKKADYVCVRGDKGFCTMCMKTIILIESSGQGKDETAQVDFDDRTSWEYLFKVYWLYLKGKLSLSVDELTQAKNPWKGASTIASVSPSTCVRNGGNELKSITSTICFGNPEANESKRRKTDEQINMHHREIVTEEKLGTGEGSSMVVCNDWATKELLDFVAYMKNGDTSELSQFNVQALMLEYIKRNDLRDPRKKSQIICDLRLKNLFGKPCVGHFEMLKLLEFHFSIKEDFQNNTINSIARQGDADWKSDNMLVVGKEKKRRNHRKGEEHTPQNKLDEYAAIDVHNMNLIYLRRKLMEDLIEDSEKFVAMVVGSIVRIRISGSDQKHDMYRLVQVVGTSKVDVPYKIGNKSTNVVLEVLNLDKKETVSIDTISNQDLSEDECRRLRQSIRCGLVKRLTVGEIQEKAVALQLVRLNDWMETEILRLNNLRDRASEKGHKKGLREYVEKLQLLKSPEERQRRLREIPEVHSDPKMNPDYETDDTEEYFNKEHEHMKPKYSGVSSTNTSSHKKRAESSNDAGSRSRKNEQPRRLSVMTNAKVEDGSTKATGRKNIGKDAYRSGSLERPQNEVDCNGSTVGNWNHQTTGNSSMSNMGSETTASSFSTRNTLSSNDGEVDKVWHYRDPSGKVQGPFSVIQLQKWSTTGYFPDDMRIWVSREDESLLLNYVLKKQFHNHNVRWSENIIATDRVGNRIEGSTVCSSNPSSTIPVAPHAPNSGQSSERNSSAENVNPNPPNSASLEKLNLSTEPVSIPHMDSPTPEENSADIKHVSSVFSGADVALGDLPSPTPNRSNEDEQVQDDGVNGQSVSPSKLPVQDTGNPPSGSGASGQVVDGAKLPKTAEEWPGSSPTPVKHEEWNLGRVSVSPMKPLEVVTSNIEQIIHSSCAPASQPASNYQPTWLGVRETIEFSILAEESVSDLLAEADAMESQNDFPSPTSRRNSFVEDLFNGSFDEFSLTPDQGTRSDGFSPGGDMHLPCQSTTITTTTPTIDGHLVEDSQGNNSNVFDLMRSSSGLQQQSFICPETDGDTKSSYDFRIPHGTNTENIAFKWPGVERETMSPGIRAGIHTSRIQPQPQYMIDINDSVKAEADEGERETNRNDVQVEDGRYVQLGPDHSVSEKSQDRASMVQQLDLGTEMKSSAAVSCKHEEKGGYIQPIVAEPKARRIESVDTKVAQSTVSARTVDHQRIGDGTAKVEADKARTKLSDGPPSEEEEDEELVLEEGAAAAAAAPPPPPALSLSMGLSPFDTWRPGAETTQANMPNSSRPAQDTTNTGRVNANRSGNVGWDPQQRRYSGKNSPRERSYHVEDGGYSRGGRSSWSRQLSFGGGGGGYSRPPPKGQHVCKFYESGRCKKGASCKYWHP